MRGVDTFTESPFTLHRLEDFVPADHPLRVIPQMVNEAVWVPTVFTKNREHLLTHDAVIELFNHVLQSADKHGWLSGEHFSMDGMLIQAWAPQELCAQMGQRQPDGHAEREAAKVMIDDDRQALPGTRAIQACSRNEKGRCNFKK